MSADLSSGEALVRVGVTVLSLLWMQAAYGESSVGSSATTRQRAAIKYILDARVNSASAFVRQEELKCSDQTMSSHGLTAAEVVDMATARSPSVREQLANFQAVRANFGEARASYYPSVAASVGKIYTNSGNASLFETNTKLYSNAANINLNMKIADFGGRRAALNAARRSENAQISEMANAANRVKYEALAAFFDLFRLEADVALKQRFFDNVDQMHASVSRKIAVREAPIQDVASIAMEKIRRSSELQRAQLSLAGAYSKLASLIGVGVCELTVDRSEYSRYVVQYGEANSNDPVGSGNRHPAIVAADETVERLSELVISAKSDGMPTLDLAAGAYRNGRPQLGTISPGSMEYNIGIYLNIPLFSGFGPSYKGEAAQANKAAAIARRAAVEMQVEDDARKALTDMKIWKEAVASAHAVNQLAIDALGSIERLHLNHLASIQEYLGAERNVYESEAELIRNIGELTASRLRYLGAIGDFSSVF